MMMIKKKGCECNDTEQHKREGGEEGGGRKILNNYKKKKENNLWAFPPESPGKPFNFSHLYDAYYFPIAEGKYQEKEEETWCNFPGIIPYFIFKTIFHFLGFS